MSNSLKVLLGIVAIIIVAVIVIAASKKSSPDPMPSASVTPVGNENISVTAPKPGDIIKSPLIVTGSARGTWYFEASFPVKLIDANNVVLAQVPAQAQGDWMTTDFVPFTAKLEFAVPPTDTGTLILEKDNPSGLPEHAAEIRIPVRFR